MELLMAVRKAGAKTKASRKVKTSPEQPRLPSGMNDPEVLAMFNELAKMKYQQYLAEEKPKK